MPRISNGFNALKSKSFLEFVFHFNAPWAKNCSMRYEIFARQILFCGFQMVPKKDVGEGQRNRSDKKGYLVGLNGFDKSLVPKRGLEPLQGLLPTRP